MWRWEQEKDRSILLTGGKNRNRRGRRDRIRTGILGRDAGTGAFRGYFNRRRYNRRSCPGKSLFWHREENNQSVPEQENDSENQSHSESQSSNMEENRTDIITKGQIPVPSPLEEHTVIKTEIQR